MRVSDRESERQRECEREWMGDGAGRGYSGRQGGCGQMLGGLRAAERQQARGRGESSAWAPAAATRWQAHSQWGSVVVWVGYSSHSMRLQQDRDKTGQDRDVEVFSLAVEAPVH